jgi:hypothetical protein
MATISDQDMHYIAWYLNTKHDPWFANEGRCVIDAEMDTVFICTDESEAQQMASAFNRVAGWQPQPPSSSPVSPT